MDTAIQGAQNLNDAMDTNVSAVCNEVAFQ